MVACGGGISGIGALVLLVWVVMTGRRAAPRGL
jgi:hypothetical protein